MYMYMIITKESKEPLFTVKNLQIMMIPLVSWILHMTLKIV